MPSFRDFGASVQRRLLRGNSKGIIKKKMKITILETLADIAKNEHKKL